MDQINVWPKKHAKANTYFVSGHGKTKNHTAVVYTFRNKKINKNRKELGL